MSRLLTSRRDLLRSAAAFAAVGALGGVDGALRQQARAATADERKFLFFVAAGGWDGTALDPKFGDDGVSALAGTDMDPGTRLARQGNLTWASGSDRASMDSYFQRWGHRTALLRGVDVHSAGHDSGMRWMLTGSTGTTMSDWPTLLAAESVAPYPIPHVVFSGPSFPGDLGSAIVRGGGGNLMDLIDGTVLGKADQPAPELPVPVDTMVDAYVYGRTSKFAAGRTGVGRERVDRYLTNLERAMELEGRTFEANLNGDPAETMLEQAVLAAETFRLGLARCAMIAVPGDWDTHETNRDTGRQLDRFFADLDELMEHLATTPGLAGTWLIDEVVVVVLSEMGRTPLFNASGGRDHWPYASLLVAGSGVRGDTVIGQTDDAMLALPVDFETGQLSGAGDVIGCESVGAALLELGGLEPHAYRPDVPVLSALLR